MERENKSAMRSCLCRPRGYSSGTVMAREKKKKKKKMHTPLKLEELIESSYTNCIKKSDRDHFRQYAPRVMCGNPCEHFPSTPLSDFQSPQLFEKLPLDTLFFIFYYQPGTYQQHLAAKELKKKSWKYHKKYTTWFLPCDNNTRMLNDKTEQGTYLSFDYESTWSKQLKEEFSFEHMYLEDEITA
ncbi:CCR4-NOT transcription complex subunit 5, putative [Plasmodium vivax]|uniref:CCR4-NOT transcription complex subunit 5, putative n=1 Tax=Plasmodium vivax TaxID=5855 RepID=A0A1G4HBD0_PLAVI|nr:CCR4-NOT transcription complex subunit 5, putative [Plasmodium vivax]